MESPPKNYNPVNSDHTHGMSSNYDGENLPDPVVPEVNEIGPIAAVRNVEDGLIKHPDKLCACPDDPDTTKVLLVALAVRELHAADGALHPDGGTVDLALA